MSELNNFSNFLSTNSETKGLLDLIESIMTIPDDSLNEETIASLRGMIEGAITPKMREDAITNTINTLINENYSRQRAVNSITSARAELSDFIEALQPSRNKKELLNSIIQILYDIFDAVIERYHRAVFELPVKIDDGAKMPTYAHETDAAADLYAMEDTTIVAHSIGNKVRTGVRIALPEGWAAYIVPRSSIGAKTPLRLSNSIGVIDSDYRGELGILYDNISDSDYIIHAGDRIAQMFIMPVYQFKPVPVDMLSETERGDGGFGSTGA